LYRRRPACWVSLLVGVLISTYWCDRGPSRPGTYFFLGTKLDGETCRDSFTH
jgi:hypothetical protein